MTKSKSATLPPLLGVIFIIAGALILVLALLNYLQDGEISSVIVFGLLGISAGLLIYAQGKKSKEQDK